MTENANTPNETPNEGGGLPPDKAAQGQMILNIASLKERGEDIPTPEAAPPDDAPAGDPGEAGDAERIADAVGAEVGEILQGLGAEQAELLVGYQDFVSGLSEQRELPPGEYLEYLPEEVKAKRLLDQKLKDAAERRAEVKAKYEQATAKAHERLGQRKEELRAELFDADPNTTLQVTLAPDDKLEQLVNAATRAGSNGLGLAKALLPSIHDRGLDELSINLLRSFPSLERSWREWQALPADEVLERQLDPGRVEQIIPRVGPDRLRARPRV